MAALQLDIDLGEGVFETVAQRDEAVVKADEPEREDEAQAKENQQQDDG